MSDECRMKTNNRFSILSKGLVRTRGEMNKTEAKYAEELQVQKLAGEIVDWWFEPFSLRLSNPESGHGARYTPDFMVLMLDGSTFVDDVKNRGMDDPAAIVRVKCAAELFPLWVFRIVRPRLVRDGGGFEKTEV